MTEELNYGVDVSVQDPAIWPLIRKHPVFEGIDDDKLKAVLPFFSFVTASPGTVLMDEGEQENVMLYLVVRGSMDVIRNVDQSKLEQQIGLKLDQFIIARLSGGDLFGELSFIRGDAKSASIKCITAANLLAIDRKRMTQLEFEHPHESTRMMKNVIGVVSDRLKQTSNEEVKTLRTLLHHSVLNSKTNLFFSYVIGLLCVYNLAIHLITNWSLNADQASIVSAGIIGIFSGTLLLMIYQSGLPMQLFGVTTRNWKPALLESLTWTLVLVAMLVLTKWILIQTVPRYQHLPLFEFNRAFSGRQVFNLLLYGFHSPIQEFVARGVLQGSLQNFFTGRNVNLRAVIVSNALFSATHVHLMNGWLGVLVFLPGLFWGWLYARNENLIGVSISHILIGWTVLFFLNVESLFR
jgi:CRP/FNR family transcriptional regulator, cyclic AMP receptor protein